MSILVYPLIDTLRIFVYRTSRGVSPFSADRNHLHHGLLDIGLSHKQTVIILYSVNVFIITIAILLKNLEPNYLLLCIAAFALIAAQIPFLIKRRQDAKKK